MPWRATGLRNLRNNSLSSFRSFRLTVWITVCSDYSSMLTCSNTGREMVKNRIFIYSLFVGDFRKEVWRLLLALVQVEIKVCENLIGLQGQTSCTLFRTGMRWMAYTSGQMRTAYTSGQMRTAYTSGQMRTAYTSGQMRTAYTSGDKMAFTHPDK